MAKAIYNAVFNEAKPGTTYELFGYVVFHQELPTVYRKTVEEVLVLLYIDMFVEVNRPG